MPVPQNLNHDLLDDIPRHIGQPEIPPAVTVRHLLMIQTQQVQDGCVKIVYMDRILNHFEAELIGCVDHAGLASVFLRHRGRTGNHN